MSLNDARINNAGTGILTTVPIAFLNPILGIIYVCLQGWFYKELEAAGWYVDEGDNVLTITYTNGQSIYIYNSVLRNGQLFSLRSGYSHYNQTSTGIR
jgi:hypothetical protein